MNSTGTGGMGGGGGGSTGAGAGFGEGGPFAWPQNKVSGSCALTGVANAAGAAQVAYDYWKSRFVTSNGAGGFLRVTRPENGGDTVSEGIGYGMLAAVYRGDQATFDGLWGYAKAHFDANGLMNWHIDAGGNPVPQPNGTEPGSASDGDEDIAWALLMASDQWTSTAYLADAKTYIDGMYFGSVQSDYRLTPGDKWGADPTVFPDYFSPAYYRAFSRATDNPGWDSVVDRSYVLLNQVAGTYGLVPDQTTVTGSIPAGKPGTYSYDACRTPWRITMDYCFNGEPRALAYLMKVGAFFNGVGGGAGNIVDGYSPNGSATSGAHNMAFIGPAGVAGMAGYPALLDGAFSFGATNNGNDTTYFPQSLRVISMFMMSGNFLDFSQR